MPEAILYAAFIVRLWRDSPPEGANAHGPAWMGELESIQTGRAWRFHGLEPLPAQVAGESTITHKTKEDSV